MSDSPNQRRGLPEDDALLRRLLDGQITSAEFESLESRLRDEPEFRKQYLCLVDMDATLYEECSVPGTNEHVALPVSPLRPRRLQAVFAAVTVAACLAVLLVTLTRPRTPTEPTSGEDVAHLTNPQPGAPVGMAFTPRQMEVLQDAAILTNVEGLVANDLKVGHRFKPGTLTFGEGRVQLDFLSGVRMVVAGPATLQIISPDAATLLSGRATAQVPKQAIGFVFNSPGAAVVDLGTEFGIQVDESGISHVEVLEGEVEVSFLGEDGNTLVSRHLNELQAVRVDKRGMELANRSDIPSAFPELVPLDKSPLPAGEAYVRSVLESRPLVYWRFEKEENGQIRNEVSSRWWADIVRGDKEPCGLQIIDGYARFDESSTPRTLMAAEPIPRINDKGYSIELWLKPDRLSHMACASIVPEGDGGMNHLNLIEVAGKSRLIHKPDSIRFLHRYPPAENPEVGTNLFASGDCTPGQWEHIVAVKGNNVLQLYSNGRLARRVELDLPGEASAYQVYLGQLRVNETLRQFVGAMDEFALYDRALTAEEVEHHYRMIEHKDAEQ